MVKRKTTYRVDSAEVQGEGSWVELSYITRGEASAFFKRVEDDNSLLEQHVIAWNWVDSEGKDFGDPKEHVDDLFYHERGFLIGKLFHPDEEAAKN